MYKITKLNRKHIDELVQIDYESEHENDRKNNTTKAEMKKEAIRRFGKGQEMFFGYTENKELIGYVTLIPFFPGYKHCEVYWLAVRKKNQGKGIGRTLMHFIENYAKKKGFRKVFAYTGKNMKKTRKFYEKIGYKFVNEFPGYYGYKTGNTTAVLYCKRI
ncbi:MAG: GNAT family N-acetyltransferase [Candidatus Aenigmarchaeota archaeon]|nr:GNAT family N-acetyltransferase [Candidatus Aenigmarchaeota archaeon]